MELGRISEIDNAQTNHVSKIQKVKEVDKKTELIDEEEYKKHENKSAIDETNEVILDNVKFGYNKQSKDFFVKIVRGDAEYKYPTEEMMKVKAYLLDSIEKDLNK